MSDCKDTLGVELIWGVGLAVGDAADDGLSGKEETHTHYDSDYASKCYSKCYPDGALGKGIDTRVYKA